MNPEQLDELARLTENGIGTRPSAVVPATLDVAGEHVSRSDCWNSIELFERPADCLDGDARSVHAVSIGDVPALG